MKSEHEIWHGYYSVKAAKLFGTITYLDAHGREVEITAKYRTKEIAEKNYMWDDKVYVGLVVKFVCSNIRERN